MKGKGRAQQEPESSVKCGKKGAERQSLSGRHGQDYS
jgi:hypothetical protein